MDELENRNDDFDPARRHKSQAQIDLEDTANELTGAVTSKMRRFTSADDVPGIQSKKQREASERAFMTRLQVLLADPAYSAAHQRLMDTIDDAQNRFEEELAKDVEAFERLSALCEQLEEEAMQLPDGTAVFRAEDGSLYDAEGRLLQSEALLASLPDPLDGEAWAGYPAWEQYQGARHALDTVLDRRRSNAETLVELNDIREGANDGDSPMSLEEIEGATGSILNKIDSLEEDKSIRGAFAQPAANATPNDIADLFAPKSIDAPSQPNVT